MGSATSAMHRTANEPRDASVDTDLGPSHETTVVFVLAAMRVDDAPKNEKWTVILAQQSQSTYR
jgi:hypothetical protein